MTNQRLKNKIMRRVYMVWFWNRSKPVVFLQLPLTLVFLVIQHEYVAFKAVASNTLAVSLNNPLGFAKYLTTAFQSAEALVIYLSAAIGIFAVLALNSIARNFIALAKKEGEVSVKIDR